MQRKPIAAVVLSALFAGLLTFVVFATVLRPKTVSIGSVDLSAIPDGEYIGVCQNKILFAAVKIELKAHRFDGIQILWHKGAYQSEAEEVARRVMTSQSLNVDAVSGATLTSVTVLKAIENALTADKP